MHLTPRERCPAEQVARSVRLSGEQNNAANARLQIGHPGRSCRFHSAPGPCGVAAPSANRDIPPRGRHHDHSPCEQRVRCHARGRADSSGRWCGLAEGQGQRSTLWTSTAWDTSAPFVPTMLPNAPNYTSGTPATSATAITPDGAYIASQARSCERNRRGSREGQRSADDGSECRAVSAAGRFAAQRSIHLG